MTAARLRTRATGAWVAVVLVAAVAGGCAAQRHAQPSCRGSDASIFLLQAQAVPSATLIPCTLPLPGGWSHGGSEIRSGLVRFWLNSDRAGDHAAELTLSPTCEVSGTTQLPPSTGAASLQRYGLRRYEEPTAPHPHATVRYYVFTGGCVTYRLAFTRQAAPALFDQADQLLGFTPRSVFVNGVREDERLTLCGAEAPPCPG
jgi:hypothetical protein